ncbi:hypothetical protein B0A52_00033 [Exophiala mesophila]|uniref:Uncharacterized protein n=1 Tax=Exophiala mesophila TaxID=212818 RepID=A0A438NIX3_EXOME|nr:hypothetical protein B0A52_00033 [Exophiala mesophila]
MSPKKLLLDSQPAARPGPGPWQGKPRTRPMLSPDRVGELFIIQLESGHVWLASDVRFVVWYHVRTVLSFDTIAAAFNSTYPNTETQMTGRDAEAMYETAQTRWPEIKPHLQPGGHYPFPDGDGWHPCDLGMCCATLAFRDMSRPCVMLKSKARLKGINLFRELATCIWEGSWENLLRCPRVHWPNEGHPSDDLVPTSLIPDNHGPSSRLGARSIAYSMINTLPQRTYHSHESSQSVKSQHQPHPSLGLLLGKPRTIFLVVDMTLRCIMLIWLSKMIVLLSQARTMPSLMLHKVYCTTFFAVIGANICLDVQMLIFSGIDSSPPLSGQNIVINMCLVYLMAGTFVAWNGW